MKELRDITGAIVDTSMNIHQNLGPGRLEIAVHEFPRLRVNKKTNPVKTESMSGEQRYITIGHLGERLIIMVWTPRCEGSGRQKTKGLRFHVTP